MSSKRLTDEQREGITRMIKENKKSSEITRALGVNSNVVTYYKKKLGGAPSKYMQQKALRPTSGQTVIKLPPAPTPPPDKLVALIGTAKQIREYLGA